MIREDILSFHPSNEQEARDREQILFWLDHSETVFSRQNPTAHMTASAWVVSPDRTRVLMAWHNLYRSWAWLGGHADGSRDLLAVASRELTEESVLLSARPLSASVFSLEVLPVAGHEKRGSYVPSHLHLNATYLFEADPSAPLTVKPDENSAVGWLSIDDLARNISEPWMFERIYAKLIQKTASFR